MNFKFFVFALIASVVVSCSEDNTIEVFDHAAQYVVEKPVIDDYLVSSKNK